ncbi:MBL fold metallo-hydrolase [Muriicola sp. SD30]|uniref:MBL fold metallo-hydrolase n=1 Tax=Muriicola sp. SD30 TaxID=3240936 RepID=UPI00350EFC66
MKTWPIIRLFRYGAAIVLILAWSCKENKTEERGNLNKSRTTEADKGVKLVILGTVQDAGSPQLGCKKSCCADLYNKPDPARKVVSLGLVDKEARKRFLLEATPDITSQLHNLNRIANTSVDQMPDGVFLTHAHIGHYTGLMYFGKEAVNAFEVPVYAMPRMIDFLKNNGPWDQLVKQKNIVLKGISGDTIKRLTPSLSIVTVSVPHRDEYSETVGYRIKGPAKKALFIPDIDKWSRWERDIATLIAEVDYAFLDATFFNGEELNTRDLSQIPHPFVVESMTLFNSLPPAQKQKIYFIHFNHTNPLLSPESKEYKKVISNGFRVAEFGEEFEL